jgi:hypothetical protein
MAGLVPAIGFWGARAANMIVRMGVGFEKPAAQFL